MSELEARFRVRLEGAGEVSAAMKRMGKDAVDFRKVMVGAFADSAKQIAGFAISTGKSLGALATGNIGIANMAKNVLGFRDAVSQLGVTAGLAESDLSGLRDQIHLVAKASNQMQDDVTEAMSAFVERTGKIDIARKNLELYGKVATATGASIKDVAFVGAELYQKLGINDQRQAFDVLTAQGKMGAVEIRDLATKAPKLFSAANAKFGVEGIEGLRGTGALAQVFARAHGGNATAGMTATNIVQMFTDMQRREGQINRLVGHKTRGLDPYEVIKEMIVKTGGDTSKLLKNNKEGFFTPTAMAGIGVMAKLYRDRKGGESGFEAFDRFKNVDASGVIDKDFATRRATGAAALKASQISITESADKRLGDSFDKLAHHADKLSGAFDFATRHIGLTAGVAGLSVVGKTVGGSMFNVAMMRAAMGNGGGAAGPAAATAFATTAAPLFAALAGAAIGYSMGTALDAATGGFFSKQGAKALGALTGQDKTMDRIVDAETGRHQALLEDRAMRKDNLVYGYRKTGMSKGESLNSAQNVEKLLQDLLTVNKEARQLVINVDKSGWEVQEGGTRSRKALETRGAPPAEIR
jgi:hypothetical protein